MNQDIASRSDGAAFDYAALAPDVASHLRETATFIKARHKRMHEDAIAIGTRLLEAKETLPHGRFLPWVEAECGWTARTAQNLMRAAEAFADKSETVSYLPAATVYALAAAPEPIRAAVLATIEAERPGAEEVKELVRVAKADAQLQRQQARKSPEERKAEKLKQERLQARQQRESARMKAEYADRERQQREAGTRVALALRECWTGKVEELVAMLTEAGERRLADLVRHPHGGSTASGIFVPHPAPQGSLAGSWEPFTGA